MDTKKFVELLDSNLEELINQSLVDSENKFKVYRSILIAFFKGESETLLSISSQLSQKSPEKTLALYRYRLRTKTSRPYMIEELQNESSSWQDPWKVEAFFTISMIAADNNLNESYLKFSQKSSNLLESLGSKKKSCLAMLNVLVAKTRMNPNLHLIPEYNFLFKLSRKRKSFKVAGICLQNIAKEYLELGALQLSLNFVNKSIQYLDREYGSMNYFLALAQKAHTLMMLDRPVETQKVLQVLKLSRYPEVLEAARVIEYKLGKLKKEEITRGNLTEAWTNLLEIGPNVKLGELEQKVIKTLSQDSLTRYELMVKIYGTNISHESAENRLKNLMNRIKKNVPGLIIFHNGKYRLSELEGAIA
jgi:hypothetical protein